MEITEVRVRLVGSLSDKLRALCSITVDNAFVVKDMKVIQGSRGHFVAMPTRKIMDRCPRCDKKNHLRSKYCNNCGARLPDDRANKDEAGKARLYVDIAHPISTSCRNLIQEKVLAKFYEKLKEPKHAGQLVPDDAVGIPGSLAEADEKDPDSTAKDVSKGAKAPTGHFDKGVL